MKLLLVDDEEDIRTLLEYNLSKIKLNIESAKDSFEALSKFERFQPDIVILDIMMAEQDGIEICKEIRAKNTSCFILMLSASADDYTKIKAYEAGCDDFVAKPTNIQLLTKKIEAIQSRLKKKDSTIAVSKPSEKEHSRIEINNILIDLESYTVFVDNFMYELPKKQFELLVILAKKPDKVHTREKIYDLIWGDTIVSERTIDVHVTRIRNKLNISCIKSVKGVGYKLVTE
ncbi:response regulator transcription factor [Flavobacteriales bacterium]|nr:response regulator transcription factor [Flavobacteriales bacterium]MDG1146037.1 response regulator transcription factor [Flavobacteriales bacterium]MDG1396691.1 response regulator transcription factor [Flavobacteriales bacterium]